MLFGRLVFRGMYHPAIAACAYYFGPFWATGQPIRPSSRRAETRLRFPVALCLLSTSPPSLRRPFLLIGRVLSSYSTDSLPFFAKETRAGSASDCGQSRAHDRDHVGTFTRLAQFTPCESHMNSWTGDRSARSHVHEPPHSNGRVRLSSVNDMRICQLPPHLRYRAQGASPGMGVACASAGTASIAIVIPGLGAVVFI